MNEQQEQQEQRVLGVAAKRQIFGIANLGEVDKLGTLGDVLSYSTAKLLHRESRLTEAGFALLMAQPIQHGADYAIKSLAPVNFEHGGSISLWVQPPAALGKSVCQVLVSNASTMESDHSDMPQWWQVEDDVVIGDQPVYQTDPQAEPA